MQYPRRVPGPVVVIVPVRSSFEIRRGAHYNHIIERRADRIVQPEAR